MQLSLSGASTGSPASIRGSSESPRKGLLSAGRNPMRAPGFGYLCAQRIWLPVPNHLLNCLAVSHVFIEDPPSERW